MASNDGSWNDWSKHVLIELERLNNCYNDMNSSLQKIHVEIAMLKVKSGIWGAIGGCIPIIVMILVSYMKK